MFFLPIGCLIFVIFILLLPVLFLLAYFRVIAIGFEHLGISPNATLLLLLLILIGSSINIPLPGQKIKRVEEKRFFGLWSEPKIKREGLAVNLGGAVIPVLIAGYLFYSVWQAGFNLQPVIISLGLMIVIAKILARVVPGKGIVIPALIPPFFSAILALALAPAFAAACAFIAGTLGVLIGGDILNLKKAGRRGAYLSIGGAGVFDGIFLVGIISSLLAAF